MSSLLRSERQLWPALYGESPRRVLQTSSSASWLDLCDQRLSVRKLGKHVVRQSRTSVTSDGLHASKWDTVFTRFGMGRMTHDASCRTIGRAASGVSFVFVLSFLSDNKSGGWYCYELCCTESSTEAFDQQFAGTLDFLYMLVIFKSHCYRGFPSQFHARLVRSADGRDIRRC